MIRYLKIQTNDSTLNRMQDNILRSVNPVVSNPLVDGQLLKGVSLQSGANLINHGLGRDLVGWIVTRLRQSATIYDTQDTNKTPSLTLQLVASGGCTADIYVF